MCKLKSGYDLSTEGDLQNVITGIILRQTRPFTFDDLKTLLNQYLVDSPFQDKQCHVQGLCYQTLRALVMSEAVRVNAKQKNYILNMPYPSTERIAG